MVILSTMCIRLLEKDKNAAATIFKSLGIITDFAIHMFIRRSDANESDTTYYQRNL